MKDFDTFTKLPKMWVICQNNCCNKSPNLVTLIGKRFGSPMLSFAKVLLHILTLFLSFQRRSGVDFYYFFAALAFREITFHKKVILGRQNKANSAQFRNEYWSIFKKYYFAFEWEKFLPIEKSCLLIMVSRPLATWSPERNLFLLGYVLLMTRAESMLEPRELTIGEVFGLSIGLAIPFSSKGGWKFTVKIWVTAVWRNK